MQICLRRACQGDDNYFSYATKLMYFSIEGLNFGIWQKIDQLKDPELKTKASLLPNLFKAAYADSTLSKYKPAWKKKKGWAERYGEINPCPADPFFVALYFNDLVMESSSLSTIMGAYCGIRWGHLNTGILLPIIPLKVAFEGAKRSSERWPQPKRAHHSGMY